MKLFVFGSNLAGRHGKGAALYANKHYGAVYGVGEGLTGNAYALPTKNKSIQPLSLTHIEGAIRRFLEVARSMPDCRFLLTPVGTGLAGYPKKDIWEIFQKNMAFLQTLFLHQRGSRPNPQNLHYKDFRNVLHIRKQTA